MYYIIGDIHGYLDRLENLIAKLGPLTGDDDMLIFLGDYIDRGPCSYEVIEFVMSLSMKYQVIFLRGNHEDMLMKYLAGLDREGLYLYNGGGATIRSYKRHMGDFILPESHMEFYNNLRSYYEGEDFIAVHGGLDPGVDSMELQDEHELIWIREEFILADKRWDKTIIFGHTPTQFITGESAVYVDESRNIIGIDTGVIFGKQLSCIRWPDRVVISG